MLTDQPRLGARIESLMDEERGGKEWVEKNARWRRG